MAASAQSKWDEVHSHAREAFAAADAAGGAVGVVTDGETHAAGFGVTNVEHPLDVTTTTLFQIGSISKTVTAMGMLRLVESGALALDAPLRTYVPGFRVRDTAASEHATLKHLLTHTAGWTGDYFADTGEGADAARRYVDGMGLLDQLAPLGEFYSYNNAGFYLAGRIIEAVTDEPYEVAARRLVLDPIGMRNAHFRPQDVMTHRFASGHAPSDDGPTVARPWALPRAAWPAGGLACDIGDLLRLGRFALGDGSTDGASAWSARPVWR
jgi:CubicO group peptidase (beta-lactamase class C family)